MKKINIILCILISFSISAQNSLKALKNNIVRNDSLDKYFSEYQSFSLDYTQLESELSKELIGSKRDVILELDGRKISLFY